MSNDNDPAIITIKSYKRTATIGDHLFSVIIGGIITAGFVMGMSYIRRAAYHTGYEAGHNAAIEQIQK